MHERGISTLLRPQIKYEVEGPDGGIVKGSELWPLFFKTDPRLDCVPAAVSVPVSVAV